MVLLIDNYDSFSYNLVQAVGKITEDIIAIRNDEISADEIVKLHPSHIIISPGPGYPANAGISEEVIRKMKGICPILGVCLGHQAICEVFGANIVLAKQLVHGKQSDIVIDTDMEIFKGLPNIIKGARYHSLVVDPASIPSKLLIIGTNIENDEIMAVKHTDYPIYGLQFHPESILTPKGDYIIQNFLRINTVKESVNDKRCNPLIGK